MRAESKRRAQRIARKRAIAAAKSGRYVYSVRSRWHLMRVDQLGYLANLRRRLIVLLGIQAHRPDQRFLPEELGGVFCRDRATLIRELKRWIRIVLEGYHYESRQRQASPFQAGL